MQNEVLGDRSKFCYDTMKTMATKKLTNYRQILFQRASWCTSGFWRTQVGCYLLKELSTLLS